MENISEKLAKILKESGFSDLTEIQKLVIPKIKEGKNIIFRAPTGYGKTLAAFLPLLDKLDPGSEGIQLLYITPLKSLNRDIFKNIITISNKMNIEVDIRHGDTTAYERANQVRMPPHCMITTPETVQSILLSKKLVEKLKNLRFVIVDEVQSLMESKRGTQFSVALERLRRLSNFQTVGISATIADFEETREFLSADESVSFSGDKKYNIEVTYPNFKNEDEEVASKENVSKLVANSLRYISDEIKSSKSTIIFTNTRETAELLGSRLSKFLKDKKMEVHHSSLSKEVRTEIENKFKVGEIDVMIATSSLELGIDIGEVDLVIQYMSPRQVIKLIQRVGRSNHNQQGIAEGRLVTINIDDFLESKAIENCRLKGRLETIALPKLSLDILAHQIVGIIIDGVSDKEQIFKIVKKSYAYRELKKEKFEEVIDFLLKHYIIRYYGSGLIRTKRGLLFYINNISSIPDRKTYLVIDSQLNKKIGVLDEEFVAENGKAGNNFIMRGENWKIIKTENQKIEVVRTDSSIGAIPAWEGELMPVHKFVAEEAADLREKYSDKFSVLKEQVENFTVPNSKKVVIEKVDDYVIIHSTFGNMTNEGIAKAITSSISEMIGESVLSKIDPYRIMIKTHLSIGKIRDIMLSLTDIEKRIKESIKRTSLYEYRFLNIAKRFGIINKYADFTKIRLRSLVDLYDNSVVEEETYREIFSGKIDIKSAEETIDRIKKGEVALVINEGEASPLTYEGLESSYGGSIIKPNEARKVLRNLVLERIENTDIFLQCMNCGYKIGSMKVENTDGLKCPKCRARYIGFYKLKQKELYEPVLRKAFKNKKLNREEQLLLENVKQNGALYLGYDKQACIVGSAYGVGAKTASRILSAYSKDNDELIDKIIEAEKNYIETKDFWN
ncbi:DEAD/DEAH box helicase [Candidatus Parvarchaeota archaeon]|nr:DEAD/DEAH box helicase [Candidatus Parvarchaeota archaeon]